MACIVFSTLSFSQEADGQWTESVSTTIFNEHIATPFSDTDAVRTHFGGTLSYEASKKRTGSYQYTHIFQAGYYYHHNLHQVAFVAWKPKFELRFNQTFNLHAIFGVGYGHSFLTQPSYRFKDGAYIKNNNWGSPHFMPSIGLGTGLHFDRLLNLPGELFFRYEAFSLAPYKPKGTLTFTANTMLSIGLKYSFN